jgi:hypothetical protein
MFENDQYDLCQHSLIWRWRIIKHHAIAVMFRLILISTRKIDKTRQRGDGISLGIGGGIDALEARTGIEPM